MTDVALDGLVSLAERSAIAAEAAWLKRVETMRNEASASIMKASGMGCYRVCICRDDLSEGRAEEMHRLAVALAAMPELGEVKWEIRRHQEDIGCGETKDMLGLWVLWGPAYEEMPRILTLKRSKNHTGFWVVTLLLLAVLAVALPTFF